MNLGAQMNSIESHLCVELCLPFQSFNDLTSLQTVSKLTSDKVKAFVNRLAESYGLRSDLDSDNCYMRSLKYLFYLVKALEELCDDEDGLQIARKVSQVSEKLLYRFLNHTPLLKYQESRSALLSFIRSKSETIAYQISQKNGDAFASLEKLSNRYKDIFQSTLVQLGLSFDYKKPQWHQENFLWAIQQGEKELVKQYIKRDDALAHLENLNIPLPLFLMYVHEQGIISCRYAKEILSAYYLKTIPDDLEFAIDNPIEYAISYIEDLSNHERHMPMGQDILKTAVYLRETNIIKAMIDAGLSIDYTFDNGMTPLHLAVNEGYTSVVQFLLDLKADLECCSELVSTPLISALSNRYNEIALLLIDEGASIEAKNVINDSSLHIAASKGLLEVVERILDLGFDIDDLSTTGLTPLYQASEAGQLLVVDLLLKKGAKVNVLNSVGRSSLHVATLKNHYKTVKILIQNDANIDVVDIHGNTPLHLAAEYGHANLAKLLLDSGANINSLNYNNETPLHLSAKCFDLGVAELLLDSGADINAVSNNKETPLHIAVRWNKPDLMDFLIQRGANCNLKNSKGLTPLELADDLGKLDIVEILTSSSSYMKRRL